MTLPLETIADVVGFLRYYDLGGLKLANKIFSAAATHCAAAIRLFDFSDFAFYVYDGHIAVFRLDATYLCSLELTSGESLSDFVSEAFRNCTVGQLQLGMRHAHIFRAISSIARTITVANKLRVNLACDENVQELLEFVDSFCRVKVRAAKGY
ncbi:hypothetical protein AAVH_28443 [Aphelenchoides avenae]|nr:hypothetical protein AAVH_28443 [Aphelenchus avenae]